MPCLPSPPFPSAAAFPYHRCGDYASSSLPYELSAPVDDQNGMYCMTITWKGFMPGSSSCYNTLSTVGATRLTIGVGECAIYRLACCQRGPALRPAPRFALEAPPLMLFCP